MPVGSGGGVNSVGVKGRKCSYSVRVPCALSERYVHEC